MAQLNDDARVNVADVKDIIDTTLTKGQIHAFINGAHQIVLDNLTGEGLSEETLTEIERYLSAHLLALRDQQVQSERIGSEYQATYQGKTDKGFEATFYGQTAVSLDPSGKLAEAGLLLKQSSFRVHGYNQPNRQDINEPT